MTTTGNQKFYDERVLQAAWNRRVEAARIDGAALTIGSARSNLPVDYNTFKRIVFDGINTRVGTLRKVCDYLGVSLHDLLCAETHARQSKEAPTRKRSAASNRA